MLAPEILQPKKEFRPKTSTLTALGIGWETGKEYREIEAIRNIYEMTSAKNEGDALSAEVLKELNPGIEWEGRHTAKSASLVIASHEERKERTKLLNNTAGIFDKYLAPGAATLASAMSDPLGMALMFAGGKLTSRIALKGAEKVVSKITTRALSEKATTKLATKLLGHTGGNILGASVGESLVVTSEDLLESDYTAAQAIIGVTFGSAVFAGAGMAIGGITPLLGKQLQRIKDSGSEHYSNLINLIRRSNEAGKDVEKVVGPIAQHIDDTLEQVPRVHLMEEPPVDSSFINRHLDDTLNDPATDVHYNPKAEQKIKAPEKEYDRISIGSEAEQDMSRRNAAMSETMEGDAEYRQMIKDNDLDVQQLKRMEAMMDCLGSGGF